MTTDVETCPRCGHDHPGSSCPRCSGGGWSLDGRQPLPPLRADRARDLLAGFAEVWRALFVMLHGTEYVGRLRLPVAMNAIAFPTVVVGGWLLLAPPFEAAFAGSWWLFDGWRQSHKSDGASLWLLASWLLLGHPLCDLLAGAVQEPLRVTTEARMLGSPRDARGQGGLRLRDRARVFTWLLVVWPLGLLLVLVPWVGLPALAVAGAAVAAIVWFEAPMAARALSLPARLRSLRQHRFRALGTGFGLQVAAAVPFVNLLALAPIATIASTASYLQFRKDLPPGPPRGDA